MASFGYTLRKAWRKKKDDLRQAKYTREHDVLFKRKGGTKVLFIAMFVILTIFVISFIFPFAWILMNSFKKTSEFGLNMMGWPSSFTFENFINSFTFKDPATKNKTILEMLAMTILIAGVGTLVTIFTSTSAAYVVAKYKFFGLHGADDDLPFVVDGLDQAARSLLLRDAPDSADVSSRMPFSDHSPT